MQYFDASALVKRYVNERGTAAIRRQLAYEPSATSRLSEVEVASALARLTREGAVSEPERDRALASLQADLDEMLVVELTPGIAALARSIVGRRALRAGDAVHLASCLFLRNQLAEEQVRFVAFDVRLLEGARGEGLETA
jgi:predicted nucleic acid-binding protein